MLEIAGELGVTEPRSPSSGPRPWSYSGTGSTRPPAATAPARRRDRFGGAFIGLKPRSGNGFA
jgi:hypothetical protein